MASADMDRALDLFAFMCEGAATAAVPDEWMPSLLIAATIPGAPPSKARPRFTRTGRTYSTKEDRAAELRTATYLRRHLGAAGPATGNMALGCVFYRPNMQRIDTDNMLKHVCDAANGVLWVDDSQVTAVLGITEYDADNPRTIIVAGQHPSSMKRGSDDVRECPACGTWFHAPDRKRRTCSPRCAAVSRTKSGIDLTVRVPCEYCATPFRRATAGQRFCGLSCRSRAPRPDRQGQAPVCDDCGRPVSARGRRRCRECWRAHVARSVTAGVDVERPRVPPRVVQLDLLEDAP